MDWTVAAQSKQELIPMWQKLNYLASVNAPDYSDTGYMSGNLIDENNIVLSFPTSSGSVATEGFSVAMGIALG